MSSSRSSALGYGCPGCPRLMERNRSSCFCDEAGWIPEIGGQGRPAYQSMGEILRDRWPSSELPVNAVANGASAELMVQLPPRFASPRRRRQSQVR